MGTKEIKNKAAELGYAGCGVIPSEVFGEYEKFLKERVEAFPESRGLYEPMYDFIRPPAECRSIVVCIRGLTNYRVPESLNGRIGKTYLFDNRVNYSNDCRHRSEFRAYLEMSGLCILPFTAPSRWAAAKAGLGKFGNNNFIYHPEHGSNIKIEAYAVDKTLEYDDAPEDMLLGCDSNCGRCAAACPTGALSDAFNMDHGRCVTHLNTFNGEVPERELRDKMGAWLYGCDVCQDVCPHNKKIPAGTEEYPLLSLLEELLTLENILGLDEKTYRNVIFKRFWYAGSDGLWLWKLNALRAMINSGEKKYDRTIENCLSNEDARLRAVAGERFWTDR